MYEILFFIKAYDVLQPLNEIQGKTYSFIFYYLKHLKYDT